VAYDLSGVKKLKVMVLPEKRFRKIRILYRFKNYVYIPDELTN